MQTYESPVGNRWRAISPEHASVRVLGGQPSDYVVAVVKFSFGTYAIVFDADNGEWLRDIPMIEEVMK